MQSRESFNKSTSIVGDLTSQAGYRKQNVIAFKLRGCSDRQYCNTVHLLSLLGLRKSTVSLLFHITQWQQCVRQVELSSLDPRSMWLPHNERLFISACSHPLLVKCSSWRCPTYGWLGKWWLFVALCWCCVLANCFLNVVDNALIYFSIHLWD